MRKAFSDSSRWEGLRILSAPGRRLVARARLRFPAVFRVDFRPALPPLFRPPGLLFAARRADFFLRERLGMLPPILYWLLPRSVEQRDNASARSVVPSTDARAWAYMTSMRKLIAILRFQPALAVLSLVLLVACADPGNTPQVAAAAPPPTGERLPTSVEDVRTQCWMRYESKNMQVKNLDEKIKLVDKCIEEKSKQLPTAANR